MLGNVHCACPDCAESSSPDDPMVCASDGLSYAGSCWVKRAACLKRKDIVVVRNQPCGEFISLVQVCIIEYTMHLHITTH